jgi:hypothetical protein
VPQLLITTVAQPEERTGVLLHEPAVADNHRLTGHHLAAGGGEEHDRVGKAIGRRELTICYYE